MADVNVSMGDPGLIAVATGAAKTRAEAGAGKDQSGLGDERGEGFEQLVAKGGKAQSGEANAKPEKTDEAVPRLPTRPGSGAWVWPEGMAGAEASGKSERDAADADDTETAGDPAASKGASRPSAEIPAEVGTASIPADVEIAAIRAAGRIEKAATAGGGGGVGGRGGAGASADMQGQPAVGGMTREAQSRGEPARAAETRAANLPETSVQTTPASTPAKTVSQAGGVPMQPGAVEPAAVQLAAVLAQGREAGKRTEPARAAPEAPAKIQVSLAETHFSPVKPDSELEAFDFSRRMDGRQGKDIGRSLRDSLRLQAGVHPDKGGASVQSHGDVRAEQLAQNIARPPSGGDIAGQIGTRILQELEQPRAPVETRNSGLVQVRQSDPALKVLEIKLEPRELGTVVVRMSLRNDVLNVELGFGKSDAAAAIAKTTDQLSSYLRSSGYDVDSIVVRVVDGDRATAAIVTTASGADSTQGQPAPGSASTSSGMAGQSFAEQGNRQPAARNGQPEQPATGEGAHGQDNSQSRSSGDLFV